MQDHDGFPQPQFNPGRAPCGECHLQTGEVCDICNPPPNTAEVRP